MKLFLRSFSSLPLSHSIRVVISYKLAQENVWLGELTMAVDLGRKATKQTTNQTRMRIFAVWPEPSFSD